MKIKKPLRVIIGITVTIAAALLVGVLVNQDSSDGALISTGYFGNFYGKSMTLDDVRELSLKGEGLLFSDLFPYKGLNLSSQLKSFLMSYSVEGGYHLSVTSDDGVTVKYVGLRSIWGGGSIDIRYSDIEEFILRNPSHPALTREETLAIAQEYKAGHEVTPIDTEWWEYNDAFPHESKDPQKQILSEAQHDLPEPGDLFVDETGAVIAVSRKTGVVFTYDNGAWSESLPGCDPVK